MLRRYLQSFWAFPTSFHRGVYVADDIFGHIISGVGPGGLPQVAVVDGHSGALVQSFFAYPAQPTDTLQMSEQNGVRVGGTSVGNKEVIVTAPGPFVSAPVKVFDEATQGLLDQFFAFGPGFEAGAFVGR